MSGANMMPHMLTGGAGYKANASYDEFLRKHSGFYRRHSAASTQQEGDRRASQANDINADAAQAADNVRRGSVTNAGGGAATVNSRKGSVAVASEAERKNSIFGMEASAGTRMSDERRPSTSLASELLHKMKGNK